VTNLPRVSSRELIKYLTKFKNFEYDRTSGSHHIYKNNITRVSIPERNEIGIGLFRKILQECGVSEEEFKRYWFR